MTTPCVTKECECVHGVLEGDDGSGEAVGKRESGRPARSSRMIVGDPLRLTRRHRAHCTDAGRVAPRLFLLGCLVASFVNGARGVCAAFGAVEGGSLTQGCALTSLHVQGVMDVACKFGVG